MIKLKHLNGVFWNNGTLAIFYNLSDDEEFFERISGIQPSSGCECFQDSEREVQDR
jgi:hypothetical protein